jgi:Zn-dependent protease with chaperone function
MNAQRSNIWVFAGSPLSLCESAAAHFAHVGYHVAVKSNYEDCVLSGIHDEQSVVKLLWLRMPPKIEGLFQPLNFGQTRVTFGTLTTRRFRLWLFLLHFAAVALTLGLVMVGAALAQRKSLAGVYLASAGIILLASLNFLTAWLAVGALNYQRVTSNLLSQLEELHGNAVAVERIMPRQLEAFVIVAITLGLLPLILLPLGPIWLTFACFLGIGAVLLALYWGAWGPYSHYEDSRYLAGLWPLKMSAFLSIYFVALALVQANLSGLVAGIAHQRPIPIPEVLDLAIVIVALILVFLPLLNGKEFFGQIVREVEFRKNHPERMIQKASRNWGLCLLVLCVFGLFQIILFAGMAKAMATISALVFDVGTVGYRAEISRVVANLEQILGNVSGVRSSNRQIAFAVLLAAYAPLVGVAVLIVWHNLSGLVSYGSRLRLTRRTALLQRDLIATVHRISKFAHRQVPWLGIVESSAIEAWVEPAPLPGLRAVLLVSSGALGNLEPDELEALLAHEIGHIRAGHSWKLGFVEFLARWTYGGAGFLSALVAPSEEMEYEADTFAVGWLESGQSNSSGRISLIRLLRVLERQEIDSIMLTRWSASVPIRATDTENVLADKFRSALLNYSELSIRQRLEIECRITRLFFFQPWSVIYCHLPFEIRLRLISSLPFRPKRT